MKRVAIGQLTARIGDHVVVRGVLDTLRDQKRMQFLVVRDRTGTVQATHDKSSADELSASISRLSHGTFVSLFGRVLEAPQVRLGGIELAIEKIEVDNPAASPVPIAEDSSLELQIDWRQISLRTQRNLLIFEVQTLFEHAARSFWHERDFIEIHSPKLLGTASESGAEVFKVEYFDTHAFLAQSPQFYKQMAMAAGFDRVFEIGPAFRAEPSFTARHETEFTSIDMEIAWIDSHEEVMQLEESWLAYTVGMVADKLGDRIESEFGVRIVAPTVPFPRVTVAEAIEIAASRGHRVMRKGDLDPEGERLTSAFIRETSGHEFCFITEFPASTRAFYHMRDDRRPDLTKGFDLLWNGLEVTTGAQREHRYDRLVEQALRAGYDLGPLRDYLNFFRYGCPPHGGMGIGLTRILMSMLGAASIREVTLLSRTPTRITP
jgi:aspartyl/asparaginyl-tRNA synthetase